MNYMNIQEYDIIRALLKEPFINQRILAEISGHSLGTVNHSIKTLIKNNYINEELQLTAKTLFELKEKAPIKVLFQQHLREIIYRKYNFAFFYGNQDH